MTDAMPMPTASVRTPIPRNDSFSAEDLAKALHAALNKPRAISIQADTTLVPPPSPTHSRPASIYGGR